MIEGFYRTAQICTNGHVVTPYVDLSPGRSAKHCGICGAATITTCPKCKANIRGTYEVPGVLGGFKYSTPSYCHNCGEAFPWTTERISAAQTLIDEIEDLTATERQQLKESIPELTKDTVRTEVASVRYKKYLKKAGSIIGPALNKIMVEIATEGTKKLLGL